MATPADVAVAEALRAVMKHRGLSNAELAKRLEQVRGSALKFGDVFISKRTSGKIRLVVATNDYAPTQELIDLAAALETTPHALLDEAAKLMADKGIRYVDGGPVADPAPQTD